MPVFGELPSPQLDACLRVAQAELRGRMAAATSELLPSASMHLNTPSHPPLLVAPGMDVANCIRYYAQRFQLEERWGDLVAVATQARQQCQCVCVLGVGVGGGASLALAHPLKAASMQTACGLPAGCMRNELPAHVLNGLCATGCQHQGAAVPGADGRRYPTLWGRGRAYRRCARGWHGR